MFKLYQRDLVSLLKKQLIKASNHLSHLLLLFSEAILRLFYLFHDWVNFPTQLSKLCLIYHLIETVVYVGYFRPFHQLFRRLLNIFGHL